MYTSFLSGPARNGEPDGPRSERRPPPVALSPADAGRGRPWPDMILTAVLRLRIDDVAEVAVVGDTASDLVAGTRSGASAVIGVLSGAHSRHELARAPHTHLIDSVADLPGLLLRAPA